MSTTVTYKGSTLTTVSNQTKTLKTAGKYMEDDLTVVDVTQGGHVTQDQDGFIVLPPDGDGGGTPTPTPTPSKWVRPSDWPDLSKMNISGGDILYMTSYADEVRGFCSFYVSCTGSYTVEVGTISGSTFTAESTQTYTSGSYCDLYYGSANGTYKVLKVTGTAVTALIRRNTSAVTIGTFYGYSNNQGIIDIVGKLPSGTSLTLSSLRNLVNVEIDGLHPTSMSSMFSHCYSLASLDIGDWDTSSVTNMSSAFSSCYSLISLDVSDWDTGSVTNMYGIFYNCYSLTSLDVSNWDTSSATNMSSIFHSCSSLTSLDVSNWDTSSATNMSDMFSYCSSLTSLDISDWDTSSVTDMSSMFYGCYCLTSLDVSGWDFSGITATSNTSSMFYNCQGLYGSLALPSTLAYIGTQCFSSCRSLKEWHFLATTPPELGSTNAFSNMADFGGKVIYVPSASLSAYQSATNWSTHASYMVGE